MAARLRQLCARSGAVLPLLLLGLLLLARPMPAAAAPVSNSASGSFNGLALDTTAATVTLNATGGGPAVDSLLAEINPGSVTATTTAGFTLALRPTILVSNTGLDQFSVTVPAGYSAISGGAVRIDGSPVPVGACPTPAGGSQCTQVAGNILTVVFGSRIVSDGALIEIDFSTDTPASAGSGTFAVSVDDTSTAAPPQSALPGDADGITTNNNSLDVSVSVGIDLSRSSLVAEPSIVVADNIATSTLTVTLIGTDGNPVVGHAVSLTSDRGGLDTLSAPPPTDANGQSTATIRSGSVGVSVITATDTTAGAILNQKAEVYFTQGVVLDARKSADKEQVQIGDVVTYRVELRNLTLNDVTPAQLTDELPPNFVFRAGSARLDGVPIADPSGVRTLVFSIGDVPALVDGNSNGTADPGEPGYRVITYQLIVGAGALPGHYVNTAYASDVCVACAISNRTEYPVEVTLDPLFDLGTIIGKVFEDRDGNGLQGENEPGIAGAMVALDDGTYIKTDRFGRYHFPAVKPGQRLLKINLAGLGNGATATTDEARVVSVTPGLLVKANFGVVTRIETTRIGRDTEYGLAVAIDGGVRPIEIHGNVSGDYLLLDGQSQPLPGGDVRMQFTDLDDVVNIKGGILEEPIRFNIAGRGPAPPIRWSLSVFDATGSVVRRFAGDGDPPRPLLWDGRLDSGALLSGGSIYQYQLQTDYADGTVLQTPRRLFGVDRTSAIAMNLTGSAFVTGSDRLSDAARAALGQAAEILRQHPAEQIIIEGHSDATGGAAYNLALSKRRAEAALNYLVEVEQLPQERFTTRWFGEARPLASNLIAEGRELNRRVEIKGEYQTVERARLLDQYRTAPQVTLNGDAVTPDRDGRFHTSADAGNGEVDLALRDEQGKSLQTRIRVPTCKINAPAGPMRLPFGQNDTDNPDGPVTAADRSTPLDADGTLVRTVLQGETEPGNSVRLNDLPLTVAADGSFSAPLALREGSNVVSLIIRNSDDIIRLADLTLTVRSRQESGELVVFAEPIPALTVQMPPTDRPLGSEAFVISGQTDPANRVRINGAAVDLDAAGNFSRTLTLPRGVSALSIEVEDPAGHVGRIERTIEVNDDPLFLLAFADGTISHLTTGGNLDNAGTGSRSKVVTEGRVAFYMKGRIAGRYLLTAALDTGSGELGDLFEDLDQAETDRLLTNLDPDKLYPVYGDDSTLVYDTESQGKLYLALDSDELSLLIGNYKLDLHDSELAAYRRTLFGGHLVYRSPSKTGTGHSATEVELFAAENRQIHVRDEVDATGGSLYYLSRSDVIEGSEQVTILVRDQLTGLPLARLPQERNSDYSIKYPEGRILFRTPIASRQTADRLIAPEVTTGNPVSIQIDYEAVAASFEKNAYGGHVRQQLGDHLALGATAVEDETGAGPYRLHGVDAEISLGAAARLRSEFARSSGSDATVNISRDGGLNYSAVPVSGVESGSAWKATAELDLGSWFGHPDLLQALLYHKQLDDGFRAAGQTAEQGTQKSGAQLLWTPSRFDSLLARVNQEQRDNAAPTSPAQLRSAMLQWRHEAERWRLSAEYQAKEAEDETGASLGRDQLAALRLEADLLRRLTAWAEQQITLVGTSNTRTALGLDYRPSELLSLTASASSGTLGRSAEAGGSLLLDRSRLYVTQRLSESDADRQSATILGGESQAGPAGSRLYSEYQLTRSNTGYGAVSLFGAEKKWRFDSGLQLSLGGELSETRRSSGDASLSSIATGLGYRYKERLKLALRAELREQEGSAKIEQLVTVNRADGQLTDDFALIGIYRYSTTRNKTTDLDEAGFEEASLGLAYRPVESDTFNALARVTHLTDRRPTGSGSSDYLDTVLDTIACEWSLQLTDRLEWVEKNALRWKQEQSAGDSYESRSWLSLHRFNYLLGKTVDAGVEYRRLTETASAGERQGWLSELGWRPKKQVRVGVGYNFTDFSDDERSLNNYSVQGLFLRIQGIY